MLTENKWRILFEIPIDRRGLFYLYLCLTGFRYSKVHFSRNIRHKGYIRG